MASQQASPRSRLLSLRVTAQRASTKQYFYPLDEVKSCLSLDIIRECLAVLPSLSDRPRDVHLFSQLIEQTSMKIFATLLCDGNESFILDFLHRRESDSKLPFLVEGLYYLPKSVADQFVERQWQFDPVILHKGGIHHELERDAILPFLSDEKVTEGGFGVVYKVDILSQCQKLVRPLHGQSVLVARKELQVHQQENERAILDILQTLQHPNIVEFLGSYRLSDAYNLLFPWIPMNLRAFLNDPPFTEHDALLEAMYGLSDALRCIHDFSFHDSNVSIQKIGFHHDLRPENILVKGQTFVIADFGLAKLKPDNVNSKTPLKGGHDDYLGPESFNYEDWTNGLVGRASDIWALGCITTEILTIGEGRGVHDFQAVREMTVNEGGIQVTNCAFHLDGQIKPAVVGWLANIVHRTTDPNIVKLSHLIEEMLNTNPWRRVTAPIVTKSFGHLAMQSRTRNVANSFAKHVGRAKFFGGNKTIILEQKLFESWMLIVDKIGMHNLKSDAHDVLAGLSRLLEVLTDNDRIDRKLFTDGNISSQEPGFILHVAEAIDVLCAQLSDEAQDHLQTSWSQAVCEITDISILRAISQSRTTERYKTVGAKAAMVYMSQIISSTVRVGLRRYVLDPGCIEVDTSDPSYFDLAAEANIELIRDETRVMGKMHTSFGTQRVMIEWKNYDYRWQLERGDELLLNMDALACLLDPGETPRTGVVGIHVLECVGWFHQPTQYRFGFVYTLPSTTTAKGFEIYGSHSEDYLEAFSLNNMIRLTDPEKAADGVLRPSLGDIFRLAQTLGSCILALHEVGWFHKKISSHNILVFALSTNQLHHRMVTAVLAGFNESRPQRVKNTFGPTEESRYYQHPLYKKETESTTPLFRQGFDYYGFGLILLELGLWQPIGLLYDDHRDEIGSYEDFRQKLITRYVPMLDERTGTIYRQAAEFCLKIYDDAETNEFDLEISGKIKDSTRWKLHEAFQHNVVQPLSLCHA